MFLCSPTWRSRGFRITQCFLFPPLVNPSSLSLSRVCWPASCWFRLPRGGHLWGVLRNSPQKAAPQPRPWNSTLGSCTPSGRWLGAWQGPTEADSLTGQARPGSLPALFPLISRRLEAPAQAAFCPRQEACWSQAGPFTRPPLISARPGTPASQLAPWPLLSGGNAQGGRADGRTDGGPLHCPTLALTPEPDPSATHHTIGRRFPAPL